MKIETYTMTLTQMNQNANAVKEELISALAKEGHLNTSAESLNEKYAVVIHHKGFFGRLVDQLLGIENENTRVTIVKIL